MNKFLEDFKQPWRDEIYDFVSEWDNSEGFCEVNISRLKNDILNDLNDILEDYENYVDLGEINHLKCVKEAKVCYPKDVFLTALSDYHIIITDEEIRFVFNRRSPINNFLVNKMCVTRKDNDWSYIIQDILKGIKDTFIKYVEDDNFNYPAYVTWVSYLNREELSELIKEYNLPYFEEIITFNSFTKVGRESPLL